MTSNGVRFVESVSWEPTEIENAALRALATTVHEIERARAVLDAAEATALTIAAQIANAQIARSGDSAYEFPRKAVASEIAAMTRQTTGAMERRIDDAEVLVTRFPATQDALAEGRITRRHVNVIRDGGINLDDDVRGEFESRAVAFAATSSPGQLRPFVERLAEELAPGSLDDRVVRAKKTRGVFTRDLPDGMAELTLRDRAELVHGVHDRLTSMANAFLADRARQAAAARRYAFGIPVTDDGTPLDADGYACHPEAGEHAPVVTEDARTVTQLRADIAVDLLLSGSPSAHVVEGGCEENRLGAIRATVQVVIPVETLAGLGDDPAFLSGYGPLHPDVARRFAKDAPGWERLFLDPDTGALQTVDHYVPPAAVKRLVEIRDETCRFPYCRQPAARCEKDHTIEYSRGGPTSHDNLECLCRTHHRMRHHAGWTPSHLPGGIILWSSPLDNEYETLPPPQARHLAATQPPGADAPF